MRRIRSSVLVPCTNCFSGFYPFSRRSLGCVHFMCKAFSLRCLLCVAFSVFSSLPVSAEAYYYWCLKYQSNPSNIYAVRALPVGTSPGWAWVQATFPSLEGTNPYQIKPSTGIWLVPGHIGVEFDYDSDKANRLNDFFNLSEPTDDPNNYGSPLNLYDYNQAPMDGAPHLKDFGTVITDGSGTPVGAVGYDSSGDPKFTPLVAYGGGYIGSGYNANGQSGTFYATPGVDGMTPLADFVPSQNSEVGGGGGSGGGGGASPVDDNINPPQLDDDGKVATPTDSINVSDGSGGSVNVTLRDYTPLLSQIAINQITGINRADDNTTALLGVLNSSNVPEVATRDDGEYTVDVSEATELLENNVSRWGFNFGFESNPIGTIFTRILGNPPTDFGSVDRVWDVDFNLGFTTVHSSFTLTSWFGSAFRSCVLMIITIIFAIASAKAVSGAFS